jgi:signal transduction histidine kinase
MSFKQGPTRILVADDTETNRYVISKILTTAHLEVIEAKDGATCLELAQTVPDLILLDVGLPDLSGYEVRKHLKADPLTAGIPVLLMSANFIRGGSAPDQGDSAAEGYLLQPVEPVVLLATVRSTLRMHEAEEQLKKLVVDLQEAVRARDEFLSIASHELRTPLTSLKLQSQLRKRELAKLGPDAFGPERLERMFDMDDRLVTRLNRLVDDMLDISRITSGKFGLKPERFDLSDLVREVADRLQSQFAHSGSELVVDCAKGVFGDWDRFRLEQVVVNLMTNAIRYGKGAPIRVAVSLRADKAVLEISDHGIGIAPDDQNRIFQRFERAVNANDASGLGLGLFISRTIIDAHQATIQVKSELGRGATFIVELPAAPSESGAEPTSIRV